MNTTQTILRTEQLKKYYPLKKLSLGSPLI